jgi:hypothetical protein
MRIFATICAIAIATVLLVVPGVRADEFNKLTYLTFSGPVQVPGVTLPAGTYMFKLADPESGRRAIQIWDEKGSKLYTTLLTIPDEQMEAKDDPVVMFTERPIGIPQAIKSWFYPGDRIGQEFIYPRSQAMKIAAEASAPVLAYTDELKADADVTAMHGAKVGRVDAQGQAAGDRATTAAATTTTAPASTTSATAAAEPALAARPGAVSQPMPSANRTESPAPAATAATTARAESPAAAATTGSTATTARQAATRGAAQATAGADVDRSDRAVGTSGQTGAAAERELPATASSLTMMQLLSGLTLISAIGVRQVRRRYVENR